MVGPQGLVLVVASFAALGGVLVNRGGAVPVRERDSDRAAPKHGMELNLDTRF